VGAECLALVELIPNPKFGIFSKLVPWFLAALSGLLAVNGALPGLPLPAAGGFAQLLQELEAPVYDRQPFRGCIHQALVTAAHQVGSCLRPELN